MFFGNMTGNIQPEAVNFGMLSGKPHTDKLLSITDLFTYRILHIDSRASNNIRQST